jgi:heptosyltransferase-3
MPDKSSLVQRCLGGIRRIRGWARERIKGSPLQIAVRRSGSRLRQIKASLRPGQRLVCIGLIEHFGDIVACEPVARHMRAQRPGDHLVWLVRPAYRELVEFHPALSSVLIVDSLSEYDGLIDTGVADAWIDLHINSRRCVQFGHIHYKRAGDPQINVENYYAYGSLLEAFCKSAGLPPLTEGPQLHLPLSVPAAVDTLALPAKFIVLHPVSNETSRDWQSERWIELVRSLSSKLKVAFVEVGLKPQISSQVPAVVDLTGRLTLAQLCEVIRRSVGFIGVDSGPAHVANAAQRPALILMGRYRAFPRYMPYTGFFREHADDVLLRWDGPTSDIPVDITANRALRVFARELVV